MKKLLAFFFLIVTSIVCKGQISEREKVESELNERREAIILIKAEHSDLNSLSRIVSLDGKVGNEWSAYVNRKQFNNFLELNYTYRLFERNGTKAYNMASEIEQMQSWNRYPTYGVYIEMMQNLAEQHPTLCKLDTIGQSTNGRLLLCLQISNNSNSNIAKPKFFYSSSIHGDELTGMVMLLRLADSILSNHNNNPTIQDLLSSTTIYICPLANPDGAYAQNNNSISNATRYNANYVDLNRNFPDPILGNHADGEAHQAETIAFINYAKRERFDFAANLHGGAEVCNFPWDCWTSTSKKHDDHNWFQSICSGFVSEVRENSPNYYFTDVTYNGVTNGGDWYVINGSRQDYHNFFLRCREITLEISSIKTPQASTLPSYWQYLGKGLLKLISLSTKGVNGFITDSLSGESLDSVKVFIEGIDSDELSIFSKQDGSYCRALLEGNYTMTLSKEGYDNKTISFGVGAESSTHLNISMTRNNVSLNEPPTTKHLANISPNPCNDVLNLNVICNGEYCIINSHGIVLQKGVFQSGENTIDISSLKSGICFLQLKYKACVYPSETLKMIIEE